MRTSKSFYVFSVSKHTK